MKRTCSLAWLSTVVMLLSFMHVSRAWPTKLDTDLVIFQPLLEMGDTIPLSIDTTNTDTYSIDTWFLATLIRSSRDVVCVYVPGTWRVEHLYHHRLFSKAGEVVAPRRSYVSL